MQGNNTIIIVIAIVVLIVAFYFINQNNKSKTAADVSIQEVATPCVPFTKAQQDAEKRDKQAKCANKLLIPFVGQAQFAACIAGVNASLTPIKNC